MERIKCFFVEDTGRMGEVRENIDESGVNHGSVQRPIYRRTDTGEEFEGLGQVPVGGMWFADWFGDMFHPQLEYPLNVRTPGGVWLVDGQASNCTMPEDTMQARHHCWIIEGTLPDITVSKNGVTCGAGAGSILTGGWHGFLRNGWLEGA